MIPDSELARDGGNIRDSVVELGHDGHPGITVAKRLLKSIFFYHYLSPFPPGVEGPHVLGPSLGHHPHLLLGGRTGESSCRGGEL